MSMKYEIYVKERYTIMPREIKWTTDDTSSSSGNGRQSTKEAHNLWLRPLRPSEKLDPRNFHNAIYPDEARRLQLIADAQPGTTETIAQRPDVLTSQANVPSSSRDIGNVHTTAVHKKIEPRPAMDGIKTPVNPCSQPDTQQNVTDTTHLKHITTQDIENLRYAATSQAYRYREDAAHPDYVALRDACNQFLLTRSKELTGPQIAKIHELYPTLKAKNSIEDIEKLVDKISEKSKLKSEAILTMKDIFDRHRGVTR